MLLQVSQLPAQFQLNNKTFKKPSAPWHQTPDIDNCETPKIFSLQEIISLPPTSQMSAQFLDACKKRTRRYYGFQTFCEPGCPIYLHGSFRDNIRVFLQECAELEDYTVEGMPIWCTFLVHENRDFVIPLFTIEENVKQSHNRFCDYCRCAGWSHHFVSKRKYHMIIPVDDEWRNPLCDGVFEFGNHLLHGTIHCNGFGHLICINGFEGGSKTLCGREIMDLWDRICNNFGARAITVEDVSRKQMMDLRLLYGVSYGHSWFGRWGYQFCRGNFGVTDLQYQRALDAISSLPIDDVISDISFACGGMRVKHVIACYRDMSETNLLTVRDLFRFMLTLKYRPQVGGSSSLSVVTTPFPSSGSSWRIPITIKKRSARCRKFSSISTKWDSRWPAKRLEFTANVIVDALKNRKGMTKFGGGLMNRQEVRDAARLQIGDTGLIDYVLKSMNNVLVGGYIVKRAVNRATRKLEYSIQEVKKEAAVEEETDAESVPSSSAEPKDSVLSDLCYLYRNVLLSYPNSNIKSAVQIVLNSKYFLKEWPVGDEQEDVLVFNCRLLSRVRDLDTEFNRESPVGEIVMVPLHSTIEDLKSAVENALRDTYCIMDQVVVTNIEGMEGLDDSEVLFGTIESGIDIWVRGYGLDIVTDLRYEGGTDNWVVKCKCGARDDDGERMVSCDICEVWQHTLCCGIPEAEAVPLLFVCDQCCTSLAPSKADNTVEFVYCEDPMYTLLPDMCMGMLLAGSVAADTG